MLNTDAQTNLLPTPLDFTGRAGYNFCKESQTKWFSHIQEAARSSSANVLYTFHQEENYLRNVMLLSLFPVGHTEYLTKTQPPVAILYCGPNADHFKNDEVFMHRYHMYANWYLDAIKFDQTKREFLFKATELERPPIRSELLEEGIKRILHSLNYLGVEGSLLKKVHALTTRN